MENHDGFNPAGFSPLNRDPWKEKGRKSAERGIPVRIEFEEALEEFNIADDRIIYVKSD